MGGVCKHILLTRATVLKAVAVNVVVMLDTTSKCNLRTVEILLFNSVTCGKGAVEVFRRKGTSFLETIEY